MIDPELKEKLDAIEALAQKAYESAESSRKYLFWTGVVTAVLIVLPLVGLIFAIPSFIGAYTSALTGAGL